MSQEILTMVRELSILRDENLLLKEKLIKKQKYIDKRKDFKKLTFDMVKQLKFHSGSTNEYISKKCQALVDRYEEIKSELNS